MKKQTMFELNINQFLTLPDWKKIQLWTKEKAFKKYPFQTKEQEFNRKIIILKICSFFLMEEEFSDYVDLIDYDSIDIKRIQNFHWPSLIEHYLTPKFLDILPEYFYYFFEHAMCYCCDHFIGYNKRTILSVEKTPIIPLYGICEQMRNSNFENFRVFPTTRCSLWSPKQFYECLLRIKAKKIIEKNNGSYQYSEYEKDLKFIHFWTYFKN